MTLNPWRQSPSDPDFVQNPYPAYGTARALGPLVFWEDYGFPVATTYAAVNLVLRDRRFGRAPTAWPPVPDHLRPFYHFERLGMLEREPPDHTRLRALVTRAFTSSSVEALRPMIAEVAAGLAAALLPGEDLITGFAEKLPATIIARYIGVPDPEVPQLLAWSHAMVAMYQARRDRAIEDAAVAATLAFADRLRVLIADRRRAPRDDLLSRLIAAREADAALSEDEIIANTVLLLNAGHEATVHTIGNGLVALLAGGRSLGEATAGA
ncbi:MAG: cytochrome P450, partial [Pseudomonadota bacterium]